MIFQSRKWLQSGYFVRIFNTTSNVNEFFWLEEEEWLPEYIFGQTAVEGYTFGVVPAGGNTGMQELKNLEPDEGHFSQFLMGIRSGVKIYREIPTGIYYGGLDQRKRDTPIFRDIAGLDQFDSPFKTPGWVTELFLDPGRIISLNAYNPKKKSQKPEVRFIGKQFQYGKVTKESVLRRLKNHEIPFRPISMGILPGKGKRG